MGLSRIALSSDDVAPVVNERRVSIWRPFDFPSSFPNRLRSECSEFRTARRVANSHLSELIGLLIFGTGGTALAHPFLHKAHGRSA
jgi:hypothetical protein